MAELHGWLGRAALVLSVATLGWLVALAVTRRVPGRRTVLIIWITTASVALACVAGLVTAVITAPPRDVLHWLYAVAALVSLPVAVLVAANRPVRQQALVLLVGAVALVLFGVRLLQTGA
jgi:hypothetical protein